jgi:methylmalonyl-CoA mutase N-terminal domain/subunit
MREIEDTGGLVAAIERGEIQGRIAERAYEIERKLENGSRPIVGLNAFASDESKPDIPPIRSIDATSRERQVERLAAVKARRDQARVGAAIDALRRAASGDENVVPCVLEAVRADATVGEITDVFRSVFGDYRKPSPI